MPFESTVAPKPALHGEKTIELSVRFWTDEMASEKGQIVPKHAWAGGMVHAVRNESHGIVSGEPVPFNSLMELPLAIERVLLAQGIVLHAANQMRKYFTP